MTVLSGTEWVDRGFDAHKVGVNIYGIPAFRLDSIGVELAMNRMENGPSGYPRPLHYGDQDSEGGAAGFGTGYNGGTSFHWFKGDWPKWDDYVFAPNAKLRVKGYILLDEIPAGIFTEYDFSQAQYLELHGAKAFADGSTLPVPSGCHVRFQPGTWKEKDGKYWLTARGSGTFGSPIAMDNGSIRMYGDGEHLPTSEYDGALSGTGEIYFTNFSNQMRQRGAVDFEGRVSSMQNANMLWIDSLAVTKCNFTSFGFSGCGGQYGTIFDYTFCEGVVNPYTFAITNGCVSGAKLKTKDLCSLPARVAGFAGQVSITGAEGKSYTIPVDISEGTNGLYQTVGCIGSGTLVQAPATGAINATFPTDVRPVRGKYALAGFAGGGSLLSGWTVTVNGKSDELCFGLKVSPIKDAAGLWLRVDKPGMAFIIR